MQATRHSRIPEQQSIGQTLPPVPVGIDTFNVTPLPPGAMSSGTRLQVGRYQVVIHNFIAEGGFAHVYLARIEGKTGFVVLKRVAVPDPERLKTVEKEIDFMRRLGEHKNIVRYYESRIDALPTGGFEALILMEYCPGGGVIDLMNRRLQQRLTEPEILKIFGDVCEALAYMHYCNPPVLHRDLKVENILILSHDHYKLCDFGSAALSKGNCVPTTLQEVQKVEDDIQRHTTLQYRAPEMIDIYQKKPINEKADIWALGVLLYKLCYYTTPFEEQGQLAILNARYSIPPSPMFSDGLRRLIISILQEDHQRRPNIYQVMYSVCKLRGVECPIRNIYPEVHEPLPGLNYHSSPASKNESPSSIFEKLPTPPQEIHNVTPMRRGRPTRHEPSLSQSKGVMTEANTGDFDPFDPAYVSKQTHQRSTPEGQHKSQSSMLGFESDFQPTKISGHSDQSSRLVESNLLAALNDRQKTLHSMPSPVQAASEKTNKLDHIENNKLRNNLAANTGSSEDETFAVPSVRHSVSSSIESRLQAIKLFADSSSLSHHRHDIETEKVEPENVDLSARVLLDSQNLGSGSIPPTKPTRAPSLGRKNGNTGHSETAPYKPKPPPKPARFRLSKTAEPRPAEAEPRPPSISEFEDKFPSVEELYHQFPVGGGPELRTSDRGN
ncbi:hypothetical protein DFQ28_004981 [Apophysomyces sp. BC1034]|nr:hypothetical protein DFQ30_004964 [Apophysomyces sp. BC1015]KAG0178064.1 hypothetical protein DFQ29_003985 [Apophysomyces sp. BC1021]KAG0188336.1 hypothetical protein DFQ28_004981 [Apophysomyces sp. BC1034]